MTWRSWDKERPKPGARVVIVYEDGGGCFAALVLDEGVQDIEGYVLDEWEAQGSLWTPLPEGVDLGFET